MVISLFSECNGTRMVRESKGDFGVEKLEDIATDWM